MVRFKVGVDVFKNIEEECLKYDTFKEYLRSELSNLDIQKASEEENPFIWDFLNDSTINLIIKQFGPELYDNMMVKSGMHEFNKIYENNDLMEFHANLIVHAVETYLG